MNLDIRNVEQVELSIDAVQNAINGHPPRPVDLAPLIGLRGILKQIHRVSVNGPPDRNSNESLQQRLDHCSAELTKALNHIIAMRPVCVAADKFFNSKMNDLSELGAATANYRDFIAQQKG